MFLCVFFVSLIFLHLHVTVIIFGKPLYYYNKFWCCNIFIIFIESRTISLHLLFHLFIPPLGENSKHWVWEACFTPTFCCMVKWFKLSIHHFVLYVKSNLLLLSVFKLSLASTIGDDTNVVAFHFTSINYNSKGARDVGLTCRCHLSNIMPDTISNDRSRDNLTFY